MEIYPYITLYANTYLLRALSCVNAAFIYVKYLTFHIFSHSLEIAVRSIFGFELFNHAAAVAAHPIYLATFRCPVEQVITILGADSEVILSYEFKGSNFSALFIGIKRVDLGFDLAAIVKVPEELICHFYVPYLSIFLIFIIIDPD